MVKSRKKILYVIFEMYVGGMENGIVNLINNSSDEFEHIICCLKKRGELYERLNRFVKIYEIRKRDGNDFSIPLKILKIIRSEKISLLRAFNEDPYFYSCLPAIITATPIIYYNGGRVLPEIRRRVLLERFLAIIAAWVVVPSKDLALYMNNVVGVEKLRIKVIENGVNTERFCNRGNPHIIRNEFNIPKDDIVVGTVGRLVPQKDLPFFIEIATEILRKNTNYSFIVAGDGPLRGDLIRLVKEVGINQKFRFIGNRSDMENVYAAMDYFLLTARWEGMSNALLEAMSAKKVVLSTRSEGSSEIIDNSLCGFIFESGDSKSFVETILKLDGQERMLIGEKALSRVKNNFSLDRMVKRYETMYNEVINQMR